MKDLGIGVIGLGMGSNMLAINRDVNSRMEVRGICDIDEEKLKKCAKDYVIGFKTTNYQELLEQDDIQIVGVYSPDHLHIAHCLAALEAGKHVICTKPMVTSVEDAERIVEAVRRKNLKFLVGQTCRFTPRFVAVKKLCDEGKMGEILLAEASYVHDMRPVLTYTPWRWQIPQDLMYGGGCHPIDLLRWFLGDVEEVFVYGMKSHLDARYEKGPEDNFLINLKFKSGKIGRILAIYGIVKPPMLPRGLSVFGTKGSSVNKKVTLEDEKGKQKTYDLETMAGPDFNGQTYSDHRNEVLRYMKHFEDCILNNKKPLIDEVEGAKAISACSACWESLRSGKPIKVRNEF